MFSRKKKTSSKLYVGDITVVSKTGLVCTEVDFHLSQPGNSDATIFNALGQLIDLPTKNSRKVKTASDLALDVIVPEYDLGEFEVLSFDAFWAPFTWRPTILITGRLYEIDSGKTVYAATVKHQPSWASWIRKYLSLSRILGLKSNMKHIDLERLTIEAAMKLLSKFSRKI